jgi:DSBA-like thioredoxin domain
MAELITVYYDYTCLYSYRVLRWLGKVEQAGRELTVIWKTFPLKEVNRAAGEATFLSGTPVESVSILALELAKAAQAAESGVFAAYHNAVFEAMQGHGQKLISEDLLALARAAGLDPVRFGTEREQGTWLEAVAGDYREAVDRWSVFGTPTLIFQDELAAYLKFTAVPPSPREAAEVFDALLCLARFHPELVEIKFPRRR